MGGFGFSEPLFPLINAPQPGHQNLFIATFLGKKKSVQTAAKFCFLHSNPPNLVLPEVWDWELWMPIKEIKK